MSVYGTTHPFNVNASKSSIFRVFFIVLKKNKITSRQIFMANNINNNNSKDLDTVPSFEVLYLIHEQ